MSNNNERLTELFQRSQASDYSRRNDRQLSVKEMVYWVVCGCIMLALCVGIFYMQFVFINAGF